MGRSWIYVFALMVCCGVVKVKGTIDFNEPFIAIGCQFNSAYDIYVSPLNQDPLQFSVIPIGEAKFYGLTYDHVGKAFYFSSDSGAYKIDQDGTNQMQVISGSNVRFLAIDHSTSKLLWVVQGGSVRTSNLDGSDNALMKSLITTDIRIVGSRTFLTSPIDQTIESLEADGSPLPDETYMVPTSAFKVNLDVEDGFLYYLEYGAEISLNRLRINDYNGTCVESILDSTRDLHGGTRVLYLPYDTRLYQDYVYVVGSGNEFSGLGRVNKHTGNFTDIGVDSLGLPTVASCGKIYIHDPQRIKDEVCFAGATHIPLVNGTVNETSSTNATTIDVPVHIRNAYYGSMIIDLVIPITDPISSWELEISFPRHVRNLKIAGCSARVFEVRTREYRRRRRGSDYVIIPTQESCGLENEDLKIAIVADIWKGLRFMKRGISAQFTSKPVDRSALPLPETCDF